MIIYKKFQLLIFFYFYNIIEINEDDKLSIHFLRKENIIYTNKSERW